MTFWTMAKHLSDIILTCDVVTELDFIKEFDLIIKFQDVSIDHQSGIDLQTADAYSGHLFLSQFGLSNILMLRGLEIKLLSCFRTVVSNIIRYFVCSWYCQASQLQSKISLIILNCSLHPLL